MCVCMYSTRDHASAGISVGSTPAIQAYDVKCTESDSHLAIYTIFVLDTINAGEFEKFYLCKN